MLGVVFGFFLLKATAKARDVTPKAFYIFTFILQVVEGSLQHLYYSPSNHPFGKITVPCAEHG
ncbi:MAG: hypothetical protein ACI92I_000939 [Acidimicrobiales bacterium]|jgi:hypothetical protein